MAVPAVKKLPALFRWVTLKHDGEFYCLNCFHSYTTQKILKKHYEVFKNHDCCFIEMPKEDDKILKYNHGENSMKFHFLFMLTYSLSLKK